MGSAVRVAVRPARRRLVPVGRRRRPGLQAAAQAVQRSRPGGGDGRSSGRRTTSRRDYDYMFVEIHTVGQDDWTTLADDNGHTTDDVGLSCPTTGDGVGLADATTRSSPTTRRSHRRRRRLHPDRLDRVSGTPRRATPAAGRSGRCRSRRPTTARTSRSRSRSRPTRRRSGLGAWVDELQVVDCGRRADQHAPTRRSRPGMDGWTLPGPPPPGRRRRPVRRDRLGARADRAVRRGADRHDRRHRLHRASRFEAITGAANRNAFMQAVLTHLGAPTQAGRSTRRRRTRERRHPAAATTAATATAATAPPAAVARKLACGRRARRSSRSCGAAACWRRLGCNARCVVARGPRRQPAPRGAPTSCRRGASGGARSRSRRAGRRSSACADAARQAAPAPRASLQRLGPGDVDRRAAGGPRVRRRARPPGATRAVR